MQLAGGTIEIPIEVESGDASVAVGIMPGEGFDWDSYLQSKTQGESGSYKAPEGGGGVTDKIKIGDTEVSFGHSGGNLEGTNLSPTEVNQAIANDVVSKHSGTGQFYKGRININGTEIEYTSFSVKDGLINAGTYYPVQ